MQGNTETQKYLDDFVEWANTKIHSDREMSAFMVACERHAKMHSGAVRAVIIELQLRVAASSPFGESPRTRRRLKYLFN